MFAQEALDAVYPGMSTAPEAGYDMAIMVDLDAVKEEDKAKVVESGAATCDRGLV